LLISVLRFLHFPASDRGKLSENPAGALVCRAVRRRAEPRSSIDTARHSKADHGILTAAAVGDVLRGRGERGANCRLQTAPRRGIISALWILTLSKLIYRGDNAFNV
jgi:hypothetical protein